MTEKERLEQELESKIAEVDGLEKLIEETQKEIEKAEDEETIEGLEKVIEQAEKEIEKLAEEILEILIQIQALD